MDYFTIYGIPLLLRYLKAKLFANKSNSFTNHSR